MTQQQVIARYTLVPGTEDEVLELVSRLAAASSAEPGCVSYAAFRSLDDPAQLVLLERYVSADALDEHRASAHFQELVPGRLVPLLASRVVEVYDVPEGDA